MSFGAGQLRQAGITAIPPADLSWCHGDLSRFALPPRLALLVPGSSAHRPQKRWPAQQYRDLASALAKRGLTPVVLGAAGGVGLAAVVHAEPTVFPAYEWDVRLMQRHWELTRAVLRECPKCSGGGEVGPQNCTAFRSRINGALWQK